MTALSDNIASKPEDTEKYLKSLIARWEIQRSKERFFARIQGGICICILLLSGIGVGVGLNLLAHRTSIFGLPLLMSCGIFFLIGAVWYLKYRENTSGRVSVVAEMHKLNDVRILPYELEAYAFCEGKEEANTLALTLLLLKLTPNDASFVKPHLGVIAGFLRVDRLREVGSERHWLRLVLAALTALKNVGDSSVIPVVEKVANLQAHTESGEKVVRFAVDCLQTLRQRAEQNTISQTLLRPADSLDEPAELLRAARDTTPNLEELLRVSSPEQS